jgi:hypothetical protein
VDHLLAIRDEVRKITAVNASTAPYYVEVEDGFSFVPRYTGGKDHCLFINRTDIDFYVYYLNKPKVVKIEEKQNDGDAEWKSINYCYTYAKSGNECRDDISGGGFIFDDKDGQADAPIRPDDIELVKTSITTWKDGTGESEDYTLQQIAFDYDDDKILKGQKSDRRYKREGNSWVPISLTVYVNGNPCSNAPYYGVTSHYYYANKENYSETNGIPDDQD